MRDADLFRGALELPDDDRHDPYDAETPEPCRGCHRLWCDGECPEYRAWLAATYSDWYAAQEAAARAVEEGAE